ncbi:MAG TPA: tetratricopeptide repeat protein [Gemmataceae bacterium]|nr:tetratricopeptide repeat protein [Gemmataceae bacterium]
MIRHSWIFLAVLLSTQSLQAADPAAPSAGLTAWQKGQQAMLEGRTDEAMASFRLSLAQNPTLVRNHLSLAAAYLALGQDEQAAVQLDRYLRAQPDHYVVRGQYAELLMRLDRAKAARAQFERFEADIQDHEALAEQHLVHCHTRLLDIARSADDVYGMHLHRGIGLYWLARQRAILSEPDGELSSEGLLCKAASELALAHRERPEEVRPCWYLYEVWSRLAQHQPATRWLRAAEAATPFGYLTPAEKRNLYLACRRRAEEGSHK